MTLVSTTLTLVTEEAAAVIRRVRALIGMTGRKGHAGGDLSEM
ncbi:hypothetical protein HPSMNH_1472 [Glaesserella parasuis MN-H]|nr:hypothetical protein HPSMNH_1472 [Glaesserella parasuis MN-H]